MKRYPAYLILHNIRSVVNVGAIFRTAECAGILRIYLTGYTPGPLDRFGRPRKDFVKSSLGAEKFVSFEHAKNISVLLKKLSKEGVELIALEQAKNSVDYKTLKILKPTAIIVGNEVRGISKNILSKVNATAEIPLRGEKESLNAATSVGIFLFRVLNI